MALSSSTLDSLHLALRVSSGLSSSHLDVPTRLQMDKAAAMPRKKTKTKKHKKERKKRRPSASSSEDQDKDDAEGHRGSRRDKNKHVSSKSTDCPRSPREIGANRGTYKKYDRKSMKEKSEGNKESHDSKHRALHTLGKHSSSRHYTSTSTKSSSSQIPGAPTKERHEWRKSLGKELGKRPDEEEEKTKKLMKRKASQEDDNPATKRRACKEEADAGSRDKKELVEIGYRKSNEERISGWKHGSPEKSQSRHSSKESIHLASAVTQNVRLKMQSKGHSESSYPTVSRESTTSSPSSSSSSLNISFKIPKKTNVIKSQTSTACWENVKKFPISTKSSPKTKESPSVKVSSEQTRPKPTAVPSPDPSHSPPVQRVQSSRTEETIAPCSSNALVELAACCYVSVESTEPTDDYEMQIVEELHLARSNRQLHVKVEMSYGELTSMDVDPADESAAVVAAPGQKQQQVLRIVLDTNVLLSHLDFVKRIISHGLGALGFPTLLVPWVVLQELDSLKSWKLSKNVENKARPAVNYIYTSLKNQVPCLWGQSMQQVSQASCGLNSVNNDDRVLQCCLQYKALYPEGTVMLCTRKKRNFNMLDENRQKTSIRTASK